MPVRVYHSILYYSIVCNSALSGVERVSYTGHCPKLKLNCIMENRMRVKMSGSWLNIQFHTTVCTSVTSQIQPSAMQREVSGQLTV